jgi:hypothetical protein
MPSLRQPVYAPSTRIVLSQPGTIASANAGATFLPEVPRNPLTVHSLWNTDKVGPFLKDVESMRKRLPNHPGIANGSYFFDADVQVALAEHTGSTSPQVWFDYLHSVAYPVLRVTVDMVSQVAGEHLRQVELHKSSANALELERKLVAFNHNLMHDHRVGQAIAKQRQTTVKGPFLKAVWLVLFASFPTKVQEFWKSEFGASIHLSKLHNPDHLVSCYFQERESGRFDGFGFEKKFRPRAELRDWQERWIESLPQLWRGRPLGAGLPMAGNPQSANDPELN